VLYPLPPFTIGQSCLLARCPVPTGKKKRRKGGGGGKGNGHGGRSRAVRSGTDLQRIFYLFLQKKKKRGGEREGAICRRRGAVYAPYSSCWPTFEGEKGRKRELMLVNMCYSTQKSIRTSSIYPANTVIHCQKYREKGKKKRGGGKRGKRGRKGGGGSTTEVPDISV